MTKHDDNGPATPPPIVEDGDLFPTVTADGSPASALSAPASRNTLDAMLAAVAAGGMDVATLERLEQMHERQLAREAKSAFDSAMAGFQADLANITLRKTRTARIRPSSGSAYEYDFASLDDIAAAIRAPLAARGLSYSFRTRFDNGTVFATCVVHHVGGHSSETEFGPVPVENGGNRAHKFASADTYARRYALTAAFGITVADKDDDADQAGIDEAPRIDDATLGELTNLANEVFPDDESYGRFLQYIGAESLEDIRQGEQLGAARVALDSARRAMARKGAEG